MTLRRGLGLALSLSLLVARSAFAVPEVAAAPLLSQAAQAHYDAGRTYFAQGDAQRALVEFRAAQRDDDRPALDYDIGLCLERLGDAAGAIAAYQRYRARATAAGEQAELTVRLAGLERRVGELELVTRLSDVRVTLDERPLSVPPGGVLRVTEGGHRLLAAKEGYLSHSVDVSVIAGRRQRVELDPIPASVPVRRRGLALGLGVGAGVVVVGLAVGLGVFFGTRGSTTPYEGNVPAITVNP